MTYNEAIKLFRYNNTRMAEALGVTRQNVYYYSKSPDKELPKYRAAQIEDIMKDQA